MWNLIPALARRRRLKHHPEEILAARRSATVKGAGLGLVVWANAEDAEAAWRGTSRPAVPRLVEHVSALHVKSGRLLATAESSGYDLTFVESLRRLHLHHGGLLQQIAPSRPVALRRVP